MLKPKNRKPDSKGNKGYRLLIMAGLSPQVITEALYLVAVREGDFVNEINVFTTSEGKKAVENILLLEADNPLEKLCRSYRLPRKQIRFNSEDVITIWGKGSLEGEPPQTEAADRMFHYLSKWTADEEPPLAVCVAGGRKNMGILFVQVFSLLARPEDRLFHLVVSPEFENLPEFFFPPPEPTVVKTYRKGQGVTFLNSDEARIVSVEIPIIRLRPLTDEHTRKGLIGFSKGQKKVQQSVESADNKLYLDISRREIHYRGISVKLSPTEFALHHFFCRVRKEGPMPYREKGVPIVEIDNSPFVEWLEESYRLVNPPRRLDDEPWVSVTEGGEVNYMDFRNKVSHSVSRIKRILGHAHPARIIGHKERGSTRYSVELDGKDIIFR